MPKKENSAAPQASAAAIAIRDFHEMLVLAQWARSFFRGSDFKVLQQKLNNPGYEGVDAETGHTRYFHALCGTLFNMNRVDPETFANYDRHIIQYWNEVTEKRNTEAGSRLELKYFQYLSLLVTELYLDWYFNRREELLGELNARINAYNEEHRRTALTPMTEGDLNKISFWEATGAGKTLLMHVNIRQYLYYAKTRPERIIVLTPNEGLSRQHVAELTASGFQADVLHENELTGLASQSIGVVDSGKLISEKSTKKKGEKSFMAESFEGRNLVLVDEGHHGSSSEDGEHRRTRDILCREGFSFEYSATFGQAVAGRSNAALRTLYAKSILFDYSYKYFYEDGYGKDAFILNMPDDRDREQVFRYLCANLLAYYQQHWLFARKSEVMKDFGIAKPLCVFVGTTVNTEDSDVREIVEFFAQVLSRRADVESLFDSLLRGTPVVTVNGRNVLQHFFTPLSGLTGKEVYADMLARIFNTTLLGRLKLQLVRKTGEVTLSVGNAPAFGLINIGGADAFLKGMGEVKSLDVEPPDEIGASHFAEIDKPASTISLLIGSKKFTEGWSSWRVSAMGLLNVGVNEGTQIIQLFGRGVRLKGRGFTLKRSTGAERNAYANGSFVEKLETLMIFGIRANYMANFRAYLEAEGVQTQDEVLVLDFKLARNRYPHSLLMPMLKDGYHLNEKCGFKTQPITLFEVPPGLEKKFKRIVVKYDDYAYLQMMKTKDATGLGETVAQANVKLDPRAFDYFDWDRIYRRLLSEKAQRGFWNLAIDKEKLILFATQRGNDWYELTARPEDVRFDDFGKLPKIKRLFLILIVGYMQKFYETLQARYESDYMEMRPIEDDKLPDEVEFEFLNNDEGRQWQKNLEELQRIIQSEGVPATDPNQWSPNDAFVVISFPQHLYRPLFYQGKDSGLPFTMKPLLLGAESEVRFVKDLERFYNDPENAAYFKHHDIYLMRNPSSRLKGIGFAQASNFYPDFMLWIVDKVTKEQYLTFIDPKGLRQVPYESPKLNFAREIKTLQETINGGRDQKTVLNSVILSDTRIDVLEGLFGHTRAEYEAKNVFFLEEGGATYLPKLFQTAMK